MSLENKIVKTIASIILAVAAFCYSGKAEAQTSNQFPGGNPSWLVNAPRARCSDTRSMCFAPQQYNMMGPSGLVNMGNRGAVAGAITFPLPGGYRYTGYIDPEHFHPIKIYPPGGGNPIINPHIPIQAPGAVGASGMLISGATANIYNTGQQMNWCGRNVLQPPCNYGAIQRQIDMMNGR